MALGYESYAQLTRNTEQGGLPLILLCTSASSPLSRVRIESSGAFGGSLNDASTRGIGRPHTYGYPIFEGSMNCDATKVLANDFLKTWIRTYRDKPYSIKTSVRNGGYQTFSNAFWRKISFSASAGNPVGTTIEFISEVEDSYSLGNGDFWNNKTGQSDIASSLYSTNEPPTPQFLNKSASNNSPIPFWSTYVDFDGSKVKGLIDWHLDFNQDVSYFFTCNASNSDTPPGPSYVAFGIMNIIFGGNLVVAGSGVSPTANKSIDVKLDSGNCVFSMEHPELNQRVDTIPGLSSTPVHSFEYTLYKLD